MQTSRWRLPRNVDRSPVLQAWAMMRTPGRTFFTFIIFCYLHQPRISIFARMAGRVTPCPISDQTSQPLPVCFVRANLLNADG